MPSNFIQGFINRFTGSAQEATSSQPQLGDTYWQSQSFNTQGAVLTQEVIQSAMSQLSSNIGWYHDYNTDRVTLQDNNSNVVYYYNPIQWGNPESSLTFTKVQSKLHLPSWF